MNAREQADTLQALVGIDTTELDATRISFYSARTDANRDRKAAIARLDAAPGPHEDAQDAEVASDDILKRLDAAQDVIKQNDMFRLTAANALGAQKDADRYRCHAANVVADFKDRIKAAEDREREAAQALKEAIAATDAADAVAADLEDPDLQPFRDELTALEGNNRMVRENIAVDRLRVEARALDKTSQALTKQIEEIDEQRETMLANAKFPVEGLGLAEDGTVAFGGLPFEQASHAEQLRVSVAMGLAANPKLRILLIRDGSLLDEDGMVLVSTMAKEADAQLWIERVEGDQPGAVVIEDGMVVEADNE